MFFIVVLATSGAAQNSSWGTPGPLWGSQVVLGHDGAGVWTTKLVIHNNTPFSLEVYAWFCKSRVWPNGFAAYDWFSPRVNGVQYGGWVEVPVRHGVETLELTSDDLNVGWIALTGGDTAGNLLSAELVYFYNGQEVGASPLTYAGNRFVIPVAGLTTGLAITAIGAFKWESPALTLRAFDSGGNLVAEQSLGPLGSPGQTAKFLDGFFAGNTKWDAYLASHGEFKGTLEVVADGGPVAVAAITFKY
jgi:hypothetical protein